MNNSLLIKEKLDSDILSDSDITNESVSLHQVIAENIINENKVPLLEIALYSEQKKLNELLELKLNNKFKPKLYISSNNLEFKLSEVKSKVDKLFDLQPKTIPEVRYCNHFDVLGDPRLDREVNKMMGAVSGGLLLTLINNPLVPLLFYSSYYHAVNFFIKLHTLKNNFISLYKVSPPGLSEIVLRYTNQQYLIPAIAHEYTHHLQFNEGLLHKPLFCFCEGLSRTAERYIGKVYAESEDDKSYLYDITERTYSELKSAYKYISKLSNQEPNKSLCSTRTHIDNIEEFYMQIINHPTEYAMGNTFYYLEELMYGKPIYPFMFKQLHILNNAYESELNKKEDNF